MFVSSLARSLAARQNAAAAAAAVKQLAEKRKLLQLHVEYDGAIDGLGNAIVQTASSPSY